MICQECKGLLPSHPIIPLCPGCEKHVMSMACTDTLQRIHDAGVAQLKTLFGVKPNVLALPAPTNLSSPDDERQEYGVSGD